MHDEMAWRRLADAGIVSGSPPDMPMRSPWYVRALLGIGGWLAAGFVMAFLFAVLSEVMREPSMAILVGLLVIGAATLVLRAAPTSMFVAQLALAVSFAGQGVAFAGIIQTLDGRGASAIAVAGLEAALALIVPHPVHRVFSAAAAGVALAMALTLWGAYAIAAGLLAAATGVVWMTELRWARWGSIVRPIAYGLTLGLVFIQATWFAPLAASDVIFSTSPQWFPRRTGGLLTAAVLPALVIALLRRWRRPLDGRDGVAAIGAALAVCAASFDAPGIPAALMLVLVAWANGNRVLLTLGVLALLGYTSAYYYMLDTTLLVKSVAMLGTGVVLLAARLALNRWFLSEAEVAHAS